ncbi:MAG: hypothetical protein ACRDYC_13895 [Acidimicrobiales bacterium]
MSAVYSQRLFRAPAFSGPPVVFFACPAGFRAVVKCISIVVGINALGVEAWVEDDEGGRLTVLEQSGGAPNLPTALVEFGTWTFEPGETLSPGTVTITADFHVSGYLLTLP